MWTVVKGNPPLGLSISVPSVSFLWSTSHQTNSPFSSLAPSCCGHFPLQLPGLRSLQKGSVSSYPCLSNGVTVPSALSTGNRHPGKILASFVTRLEGVFSAYCFVENCPILYHLRNWSHFIFSCDSPKCLQILQVISKLLPRKKKLTLFFASRTKIFIL